MNNETNPHTAATACRSLLKVSGLAIRKSRAFSLRELPRWKVRGDIRLERTLVVAEPRIAIDAEHGHARIGDEVRRKRREIARKLAEQHDHRAADVLLVLRLARAEPLAIVVPLERPQERERLPRERRRERCAHRYARTCRAAANRSCI